jgi:hypothetical protein
VTDVTQFIQTVWRLVATGRWNDLRIYLLLIEKLLNQPRLVITPGKPKDKET